MKQLYVDLTRLKPGYHGGAARFAVGLTNALPEAIIVSGSRNEEFLAQTFPGRRNHGTPHPGGVVIAPMCTMWNFGPIDTILCIHDIQHEVHPENFSLGRRLWRRYEYRASARKATWIQVSSNAIWRDLTKYMGVPAGKIFLAPEGYDEKLWSPDLMTVKPRLLVGNIKPFIYYPAGLWKHKNHETVIKGLSATGISLVLTGKDYGEYEKIRFLCREYDVPLVYLGIIPEIEMRWLYKNAICTIAAGYYESGCLPVKEALACGGKVLAANIGPNMELLGLKDLWHFEVLSPTSFNEQLKCIIAGNTTGGWRDLEEYRWSEIAKIYRRYV